jgi:hypothetical protein
MTSYRGVYAFWVCFPLVAGPGVKHRLEFSGGTVWL